MENSTVVLHQDANLRGKDLTRVYQYFKGNKPLPNTSARFKKKEPLEGMAKSILKHRIQTLTEKNIPAIESELGYQSPDGAGLTVDMLKRLAHFLILEACGELEQLPEPLNNATQTQEKISTPTKRKRPHASDDQEQMLNTIERQPISKNFYWTICPNHSHQNKIKSTNLS